MVRHQWRGRAAGADNGGAGINNADEMQIDYRLQRTANGWKIYDINMMGAWLIEVYRKQFADIVARSGVEGLVTLKDVVDELMSEAGGMTNDETRMTNQ